MSDDILMLDQDYQELKEDPEIQEEIKNIIEESKVEDERKEIDKSDVVIPSGIPTKFLHNNPNIDLTNYDVTTLWINPSPTTSRTSFSADLLDDFTNYDLLCVDYKVSTTSQNIYSILFPVNELSTRSVGNPIQNVASTQNDGTLYYPYRTIYRNSSNTTRLNFSGKSAESTYNIPVNIYGLNSKQVLTPDPTPTPQPTVSGNIINNYYNNYYTVSDDQLSWNIINKPLNEYTVTESYFAISTMLALCIGIYLIIRRSIFKWR